jgi:hypothetical protein
LPLESACRAVEPAEAQEHAVRTQGDEAMERSGHGTDETLRFESLEAAPIDDTVGRVVDLGTDAAREADRTDGARSVGVFINDPFRDPEASEGIRRAESERKPSPVPAARRDTAPRPAGDECVITVPVLLTRSQTRKNIPIKLRLEVQVVDEDEI